MADQVGLPDPEELGALETACAIIDAEVERAMRLRDAREDIGLVTAKVRAVVAHARDVQARVDTVQTELVASEQRLSQLQQRVIYDERNQHQQREAWQHEVQAQKQIMAEQQARLAQIEEDYRTAREGLLTRLAAEKAQQEHAQAEMLQAHQAQIEQKKAELHALETQVQTAQRLRDQLTALRG